MLTLHQRRTRLLTVDILKRHQLTHPRPISTTTLTFKLALTNPVGGPMVQW